MPVLAEGIAQVPTPVKQSSRQHWLEPLAAAAILAVFAVALAVQARLTGVTVDEPSHLVSASLYWRGADRLRPGDMPPLIKIAAGWVPARMTLPLPSDLGGPNETRHEWNVALGMMLKMPLEAIRRTFFWSRLPFVLFPLLTAVILWRWGRQLFGPVTALILMAAFALEPTVLGHGALFKNDLAATFGYTLFWFAAWKYWKSPSLGRAAWLGAALAVALMSKLSMLFLVPLAPLIALLRMWRTGRKRALPASLVVLSIAYVAILAGYRFEARQLTGAEINRYSNRPEFSRPLLKAAQVFRIVPVPDQLWNGCISLMYSNGSEMPIYLLGKYHWRGTPAYFPVALALKAPEVLLLLVGCGSALALIGLFRRRWRGSDAFWLLPGFLYIGLASFSALQFGLRLALPALPFGLLLAGIAVRRLLDSRGWWVAPVLLTVLAAGTAAAFPNYIPYFNWLSGGPKNGVRYLSGSNIDWGQGLPQLAGWVRSQHIPRINLSYFGTDHAWAYFKDDEIEAIAPPYSEETPPRLVPQPGYYAISASLLPGQFVHPKRRDYYEAFRKMTPVKRVAESIYVYEVR